MRIGMRIGVGLAAAAAVAGGALWAGDDIGKMSAKDVMKKGVENMDALAGYHVNLDVEVSGIGGGLKAEGLYIKPDIYYLKSDLAEIYIKGKKAVASNPATGGWVDSKGMDPAVAAAVTVAQSVNPAAILALMAKNANPKFRDDEKVGDVDCKVVEAPGSADDAKRLIEEQLKGFPMAKGINPSQIMDTSKSKSTYVAWIGKEDLLVHKLEATVHAEMKANPNLPIPSMDAKTTIDFSKHGKELDLNAPEEVKKMLALK